MLDLPPPISVEAALEPTGRNIEVPQGETITMGPFEPHYASGFRIAEVKRFDELHRLGFVNEKVGEQDARSALLADARLFRELSFRSQLQSGTAHPCNCGGAESPVQTFKRSSLQQNLIDVLQPLSTSSLDARSPLVLHTYRNLTRFFSASLFLVGLFRLQDISIGDRATLIMTPAVSALFAGTITIGNSGTLRFQAGAVHVRCTTLSGPSRFSQQVTNLARYGRYLAGISREQGADDARSNH
jgi:hypothetical protein